MIIQNMNKRNLAEVKFCEWLDKYHKVCWDFIDQEPETLAELYRGRIKRPDVLIMLDPSFPIAVDIKRKPLNEIYRNFTVDEEERKRELGWEKIHNTPVFHAFAIPNSDYKTWFFLRLSEATNLPIQVNHTDGTQFRTATVAFCTAVSHDDTLLKLFRRGVLRNSL